MKITFVKTGDRRFERTLKTIIQRRGEVDGKVEGSVRKIIQAVRQDGDRALLRYARTFDGNSNSPLANWTWLTVP